MLDAVRSGVYQLGDRLASHSDKMELLPVQRGAATVLPPLVRVRLRRASPPDLYLIGNRCVPLLISRAVLGSFCEIAWPLFDEGSPTVQSHDLFEWRAYDADMNAIARQRKCSMNSDL